MADQLLTDSFTAIRDRLKAMPALAYTNKIATSTAYADQIGGAGLMPRAEVTIRRVVPDRIKDGTNRTRFTVTALQEIFIDEILASFDGQTQEEAMWNALPLFLQYFEEHRSLQYAAAPTGVPWLEDENSGIVSADVIVKQGDDNTRPLTLAFTWVIYLDVTIADKRGC